MVHLTTVITALAAGAAVVDAHPSETWAQKRAVLKARSEYIKSLPEKDLVGCTSKLKSGGAFNAMIQRREAALKHLRKRNLLDVHAHRQLNKHVAAEAARTDVKDGEQGVPLHLDIQVVDINTCEPIKNAAIDVWHGATTDSSNVQNNALGGIHFTDKNGAVQFETTMPGHYMGTTHHIHVMTTLEPTVNKDRSISERNATHVGQLYLDQNLLDALQTLTPSSSNEPMQMKNKDDMLLMQGAGGGTDPIVQYGLLGKDVKDGVFAWTNFAINSKVKRQVSPAASSCSSGTCNPQETDWMRSFAEWFNTIVSYQFAPISPALAAGSNASAWEQFMSVFGGIKPGTPSAPAKPGQDPPKLPGPVSTNPSSTTSTTSWDKFLEMFGYSLPKPGNGTAPAFPNIEGATIGAGVLGLLGAMLGGVAGAFSTWNYASFQEQLAGLLNMTNGGLAGSVFGATPSTAAIPSEYMNGLASIGSLMGMFPTAPPTATTSRGAAPTPLGLPTGLPSGLLSGLAGLPSLSAIPAVPPQSPVASSAVPGVAPTAKAPGPASPAVPPAGLGTVPKGAPPAVSPAPKGGLPPSGNATTSTHSH